MPPLKTKELLSGKLKVEDIQLQDLSLMMKQKGVDMRIGVDIASLAYKKQVNQIILIAGDSDFVPAAKLARREGIDFVLDPLGAKIKENLFEHIDGLNVKDNNFKGKFKNTPKIKNPTATNSRTSSKLTPMCFYCTQFYHKGAQQWNKLKSILMKSKLHSTRCHLQKENT